VLAGIAFFVILGTVSQRLAQRRVRVSLETLQRVDPRPPILFLRAFGDDQVPLRPSKVPLIARLLEAGRRRTNLDHMLLGEATPYGPVVGLGKPGDSAPPYGAARGYFDNRSWQGAVTDLASDAAAVVICLDDTDGILWEIEHLVASKHLEKTLFLVHPKYAGAEANRKIIERVAAFLPFDAGQQERLFEAPPLRGKRPETIIGFYVNEAGGLQVIRSATHADLAYLLTLRLFLREKLGINGVPIASGAAL
jgi:hypothetical protein